MNVRRHLVGVLLLAVLTALSGAGAAPAVAVGIAQQDSSGSSDDSGDETGESADGYGRMMLVLDSSGSMAEPAGGGETKIAAARSSLRTVIESLPADAQVGLRVFGAEVFSRTDPGSCEDSQQVVEPGTDNRDELLGAIDEYEPYGETPIPYALREAAKDLGSEGARSIVLVSDGESTCQPDPCEVAGELADQGIDLRIDVVGLSVDGAARDQLQCIAEAGGGTYYDADSAEDIEGDLTRVAERAIRPFTLTGSPIDGGTPESPTPIEVGDWIDTFGPAGTDEAIQSYVYDRTIEGSTLRVSAITQGRQGDEGLRVELLDPEGDRCDYSSALRQLDARDVLGVQATASEETDCTEPGQYVINVERRLADEKDAKVGIRVTEEPPFTDIGYESTGDVEVAAPQVSGAPSEVVGGTSFANATALESGSYSSTIVPGEALMYSVPVEFGQAVRVRVTFPSPSAAVQDTLDGRLLSNVLLFNPMQALLGNPSGSTFSDAVGDDESHELLTATGEVSRASVDSSGVNGVDDYSTAGDYYVGVSLASSEASVELPFTLDVEVVGEPQEGPTYADGVSWSVAEGTVGEVTSDGGEESPSAEPSMEPGETEAAPAEESGGMRTVGGVVAGLLGLAVLAAAFLTWRRRAAPAGGSGEGPGGDA